MPKSAAKILIDIEYAPKTESEKNNFGSLFDQWFFKDLHKPWHCPHLLEREMLIILYISDMM